MIKEDAVHIIKTLLVGLLMCLMTALHAEDLTERTVHKTIGKRSK